MRLSILNFKQFLNIYVLLALSIVFISCGKEKEIEEAKKRKPKQRKRPPSKPDASWGEYIDAQKVECKSMGSCAEYMAKILVIDDSLGARFCTGTLLESSSGKSQNIMMTSSSCLFENLRDSNLECSASIFVYFPETRHKSAQKVGCKKILTSDHNRVKEPALWRHDFAFFELDQKLKRKGIQVQRNRGFSESRLTNVMKYTAFDEYNGEISIEHCRPVFNSFINPFARFDYSPAQLLSGCEFKTGNKGGLISYAGKAMGVISSDLYIDSISYVLENRMAVGETIENMFHASSLLCKKLPFENRTRFSKKCKERINYLELDKARSRLDEHEAIHLENKIKIANHYNEHWDHIKWGVKFYKVKSSTWEAEVYPKCFYKPLSWGMIRRNKKYTKFSYKDKNHSQYILKTKFNKNLKVVSGMFSKNSKKYKVTLNPKSIYNFQTSKVTITSDLRYNGQTYPEISECPEE